MTKPPSSSNLNAVRDLQLGSLPVTQKSARISGLLTPPASKEDLQHRSTPPKTSNTPNLLFRARSRPVKGSLSDRKKRRLYLDTEDNDRYLGGRASSSYDPFGPSYPINTPPRTVKYPREKMRISASYPLVARTPVKSRPSSGKRVPGSKLWVLGTYPTTSLSFRPLSSPSPESDCPPTGVSPSMDHAASAPESSFIGSRPAFGAEDQKFELGLEFWETSSSIFSQGSTREALTPTLAVQTLQDADAVQACSEVEHKDVIPVLESDADVLLASGPTLFNGYAWGTVGARDVPLGGDAFTHLDEEIMGLYEGNSEDETAQFRGSVHNDPYDEDPYAPSEFVADEALDRFLLELYEGPGNGCPFPQENELDVALLALYEGGHSAKGTFHHQPDSVCSCCPSGIMLSEISPDIWPFSYHPRASSRYHLRPTISKPNRLDGK